MLCGNPAMLADARKLLSERGFRPGRRGHTRQSGGRKLLVIPLWRGIRHGGRFFSQHLRAKALI